jgi:hypothetical protein
MLFWLSTKLPIRFLDATYCPQATTGLVPISKRRALLSTLLHAAVEIFTQFSECIGTDCK